jgi:hypothetical protein
VALTTRMLGLFGIPLQTCRCPCFFFLRCYVLWTLEALRRTGSTIQEVLPNVEKVRKDGRKFYGNVKPYIAGYIACGFSGYDYCLRLVTGDERSKRSPGEGLQ